MPLQLNCPDGSGDGMVSGEMPGRCEGILKHHHTADKSSACHSYWAIICTNARNPSVYAGADNYITANHNYECHELLNEDRGPVIYYGITSISDITVISDIKMISR